MLIASAENLRGGGKQRDNEHVAWIGISIIIIIERTKGKSKKKKENGFFDLENIWTTLATGRIERRPTQIWGKRRKKNGVALT